jgi:hypothetical protein
MSRLRTAAAFTTFAVALLAPVAVLANPRPLPFSYPYETLPAQGLEVEQVVDLTPIRVLDASGDERWTPRSTLVTEIEYGLTNRLELGIYIQLADSPASGNEAPLRFDGLKQRLRYRFADPGAWPVEVAIYGEVAELRDEVELEGKIILQRRLGPVRLISNLWIEREFYYQGLREWVFHPTLGAAYELSPAVNLGLEGWLLKEIGAADGSNDPVAKYNVGPLAFVGPTVFAQGGRGWIAVGAYVRATDPGRAARVGDQFGRYWVRMMLGIDL